MRDTDWASWTCVLGWPVQGIYPAYSDGSDVNACDRSKDRSVLVTGDDFGKVRLFRYPVSDPSAESKHFGGHSSHVTNVRFSADGRFVFSAGGGDLTVMQWKRSGPGVFHSSDETTISIVHDVDDHADETDISDVDSDVVTLQEHASGRKLEPEGDEFVVDVAAGEEFMAVKPWKAAIYPPSEHGSDTASSKVPSSSLSLEFVHGYRGHDCRDNLFYTATGELVYSAAAVGIVYNKKTHTQRFYLGHTDDIICVALHGDGRIVATGEIGKKCEIHVWDVETTANLAVLKGFHDCGVVAVAFSESGDQLVSIGDDDRQDCTGLRDLLANKHGERRDARSNQQHANIHHKSNGGDG
jgi:WD40 repeat protein